MVAQASPTAKKPDKTRLAEGHALKANRRLNHREKRFCALVVNGMAARRAYMAITGMKNTDSASTMATRWMVRPAVASHIAKLRSELTEEGTATRAERMHHLARVMRDDETPPNVIVQAVAVNNRMTGDDEPFRRAESDSMRVQLFVLRLGAEDTQAVIGQNAMNSGEPINVTPIQIQDGSLVNVNAAVSADGLAQANAAATPTP